MGRSQANRVGGLALASLVASALLGPVSTASAVVISVSGSESPVYTNAPTNSTYFLGTATPRFHGVRFANCAVGPADGVLSLSTVNGQGVWFGWHPSFTGSMPLGWSPAGNTAGNELKLRSRLGSSTSTDWHAYFHDGTHSALIEFADRDTLTYSLRQGNTDIVQQFHLPTGPNDFTDWHDIRIMLKGGLVGYYVDGVPIYQGPAASGGSSILIIGDGSGPSISGVGSWQVDALQFETAPLGTVPEPAGLAALACGVGVLGRRTRRV